MSTPHRYGIDISMGDIAELTSSGDLKYRCANREGEDEVEVVLRYNEDDDGDDESGFRIDGALP